LPPANEPVSSSPGVWELASGRANAISPSNTTRQRRRRSKGLAEPRSARLAAQADAQAGEELKPVNLQEMTFNQPSRNKPRND
jgi:hypothetical protein